MQQTGMLFDHLVGGAQLGRRYGQAQRFRRPNIDDQLQQSGCMATNSSACSRMFAVSPCKRSSLEPDVSAFYVRPFIANFAKERTVFGYPPGSNPFALKCDPASCPARKSIKAFEAFADADSAPIPPLKCVMLPSSPGSGPTSCVPAFGTISDACAMPSSTSPFATKSGDCAPGTSVVLDFICSAIPRRSMARPATTPLSPPSAGSA